MSPQEAIDAPSFKGKFGWERIGPTEDLAIPVIVRNNQIRYSPVRIVEQEIIKKYGELPQPVFNCITLKSFYLTNCEAKLLNKINHHHSNNIYGEHDFYTKDVIISANDVKELSRYLNISYQIFLRDLSTIHEMFGVIKLRVDPDQPNVMLVPYLTKLHEEKNEKFVPDTLIDKFVTIPPGTPKGRPNDWDIMYLKMLCIYCENGLQQHITKEGRLIQLSVLKYNKTNTPLVFELYKSTPRAANPNGGWTPA